MRNLILLFLLSVVIVSAGACSRKGNTDNPDNGKVVRQTASSANGGLIGFVKQHKLTQFPSATIGDAFDSYRFLTGKEWKMDPPSTGRLTVVFSGWFDSQDSEGGPVKGGVARRGLDARFVVNTDGSFYLASISLLEVQPGRREVRRRSGDVAGILSKIYADERINP